MTYVQVSSCQRTWPPSSPGCATRSAVCAIAWVWGESTAMTHSHRPHDSGSDLIELAVPYAPRYDTERDDPGAAGARRPGHRRRVLRRKSARSARPWPGGHAATAAEPPDTLRDRLLTAVADDNVRNLVRSRPNRRGGRRRRAWLSAAAAVAIGLGALGVGLSLRPPAPRQTTAQRVFSAPDVHTVSGAIPAGGTATVVFLPGPRRPGVLVMNDVPPPSPGTVYQVCGWSATRVRRRQGPWTPPRWHRRPPRCCRILAARPNWRSPSNRVQDRRNRPAH